MLRVTIHPNAPKAVRNNLTSGRWSLEDLLGLVTVMLDGDNESPIREQLDRGYSHGGGWRPIAGFKTNESDELKYPGDPVMRPWLKVEVLRRNRSLRATLITYESAFFALYEAGVVDGFEVSRMD